MECSAILERLSERTRVLVTEELRSTAVVLRELRALIAQAHARGHSHKSIHARLESSGLRATWQTYKSCLKRMAKTAAKAQPAPVIGSLAHEISPSPPIETSRAPADSPEAGHNGSIVPRSPAPIEARSATHVLDTLAQARDVATSRDYAQISRDLFQEKQRQERARRILHTRKESS